MKMPSSQPTASSEFEKGLQARQLIFLCCLLFKTGVTDVSLENILTQSSRDATAILSLKGCQAIHRIGLFNQFLVREELAMTVEES